MKKRGRPANSITLRQGAPGTVKPTIILPAKVWEDIRVVAIRKKVGPSDLIVLMARQTGVSV